jgi:hypothetical protein
MEWIFSGIGTAIVSFVLGLIGSVLGFIVGRKYQENVYKSKQVSGENSIQINSSVKADNVENTHVIGRDMIINHAKDESDIGRMANMSNSEIEEAIRKGNDATVRAWCRELILENKQEYLIKMCIEKMTNDQEKYKLLKELADREVVSTKYCRLIENSITNNVNLSKLIELYLPLGLEDNVASIFKRMNNNTYILKSLKFIYPINRNLFNSLYENGSCFNDDKYIKEMEEWISAQCEKSL